MKAVILAAGIASRLRPLTDNRPKCLLHIGPKCLLERTIDALIENGLEDIVIVTGYLNDMIETFVSDTYPNLNVEFIHNSLYRTTNNIYSLWLTRTSVAGSGILLLDSDILFDPAIIATLLQSARENCLALNIHELGEEEIKVIADSAGRIREIGKTCSIKESKGESIGIEKMSGQFTHTLFEEMERMIVKEKQSDVFYEVAFENIISNGAELYAVDTTGLFSMELDTVEDFENACHMIPEKLK